MRSLDQGNVSRAAKAISAAGALGLSTLIIGACSDGAQEQSGGLDALAATSVEESTLPQTIPFHVIAGHPVIDVQPDGAAEPLSFMLDSGAPTTFADQVAADHAGDAVGSIQTQALDGSVVETDIVAIDSLALGGAVFKDVAGPKGLFGPDNPLSCVTDHGIIGANLMKDAVWQFDYGAQEVTIAPSVEGLDHIEGAIVLDFTTPTPASPSPHVGLTAPGGEVLEFILDTGSDGGLTLNPADLEAAGVTVDPAGPTLESISAGSSGTFESALIFAGVDLGIGDAKVDGYPVATLSSVPEKVGNMGNDFLDGFVLTLDWPGQTVYLDPVADDGSIPTPSEPPAVAFGWDGTDVTVRQLVRGGAAAEAGLKVGDVVATVDGVDYSDATRDDFCALLGAESSDGLSLTTADGQAYDIEPITGFFDTLGG